MKFINKSIVSVAVMLLLFSCGYEHTEGDGHDHGTESTQHSEDDGHGHGAKEESHSEDDGHGHGEEHEEGEIHLTKKQIETMNVQTHEPLLQLNYHNFYFL